MNEGGEEIVIWIVSVADTNHVFLSAGHDRIALRTCESMENGGRDDCLKVRAGRIFCDQSLYGRAAVNVKMPAWGEL